jgi:excinuclease ABC subunit C
VTLPPATTFCPAEDALDHKIVALPVSAGIYRVVPLAGEPHISWSSNLPRRIGRLLRTFQTSISHIDSWPTASRLDTVLLSYVITRDSFPTDYLRRLRLRMPWFVRFSDSDAFPQLLTTNRVSSNNDFVLGPFASRDYAQYFQESAEALFQLRRCLGQLLPSPDHPGCIYGEMNQCLRPCQSAVTRAEYATEVERMREFLSTSGRTTLRTLSLARDHASAAMDFELAAQVHKRLEKVKEALRTRDEIAGDVHSFCGVALTPGFRANSCSLRAMYNGCWQESVVVDFSDSGERKQSIDADVRQRLDAALSNPSTTTRKSEHLALFTRWYYSSWRDGEWFPYKTLADLDYRKLVRQISKLAGILNHKTRP